LNLSIPREIRAMIKRGIETQANTVVELSQPFVTMAVIIDPATHRVIKTHVLTDAFMLKLYQRQNG
jgi:hypothetical protein